MKIPNSKNAFIPISKLSNYLLSGTHAVGKSKAKFFHSLGFNVTNMNLLEKRLLNIAQTEHVAETISTPYGTKYVIEGVVETPSEIFVNIRTIWIIEQEEVNPRFVTAYPT